MTRINTGYYEEYFDIKNGAAKIEVIRSNGKWCWSIFVPPTDGYSFNWYTDTSVVQLRTKKLARQSAIMWLNLYLDGKKRRIKPIK